MGNVARARSALARGISAFLSVTIVVASAPAKASPADIFSSPAPALESEAPKATELKAGDSSVATQTGAFEYSYPITVPPGRQGMAPKLALTYSSQAPVYGGVAAGWSLPIPEIREDTSVGRLRTHSPEVEVTQTEPRADDEFVSSMAGGRPLVAVTEPSGANVYKTYRAQGDSTFARYERMNSGEWFRWRVLNTDGTIMYFGHLTRTLGCTVRDGFAPLTGVVDSFGNEIVYEYESAIAGECRIKRISWGQNAPANAGAFAQVVFGYVVPNTCAGIEVGSQRDYRTGTLIVTGASKLGSVTATAFAPGAEATPDHTRIITMTYGPTELCNSFSTSSPYRTLVSIQESAWGTDSPRVDLPAVTFDYGSAAITLTNTTSESIAWGIGTLFGQYDHNLGWGYRYPDDRWPSVEAMMIDMNGDGLPDRLMNESTPGSDGQCKASWRPNLGPQTPGSTPQFGTKQTITLPRLLWTGNTGTSPPGGATTAAVGFPNFEGCALNRQVTAFRNSNDPGGIICHDNTSCTAGTSSSGDFCYPGGTECPPGAGGNGSSTDVYRTYLAYRWMDMDGDGLTDLVAAVHGDIDRYDIVQGNAYYNYNDGRGLRLRDPEPSLFGQWPACPQQADRCKALTSTCMDQTSVRDCPNGSDCTIAWNQVSACLSQAQQSGCYGLVGSNSSYRSGPTGGGASAYQAPYTRCEGLYPWFIYKNLGSSGFSATPVIKYQPLPLESDSGDSSLYSPGVVAGNHGIVDIDGDGILDAVAHPISIGTSFYWWFVWLGDQTGGFGSKRYTFMTRKSPKNHISAMSGANGTPIKSSEGLVDLNGDGLPDHWLTVDPNQDLNANIAFSDGSVHRLKGTSDPSVQIGEVDTPALDAVKPGDDAVPTIDPHDGPFINSGSSIATNRLLDVDQDRRPDVVQQRTGSSTKVFYNVGGQFAAPGAAYSADSGATGWQRYHEAGWDNGSIWTWQLFGDLIDLDGNGLPESATFTGTSSLLTRKQHDPVAPPPRLLSSINNGRGLTTSVTYASMHDSSAVVQCTTSVCANPTWSDGRPKASPVNQWVVKKTSTSDTFAGTTSEWSYLYKYPRHSPGDHGLYGFRGFQEVITTSPSGSKAIQRYGYTLDSPAAGDWSGRLIETLVVPAEAPGEVRSIDRTTWTSRGLFNGPLLSYHVASTEHLVCKNGQTESGANACTPTTAAGYTKKTTTLSPLASTTTGGPTILWQPTETLLQSGVAEADGDRRTVATFALNTGTTPAAAPVYRLRALTSTNEHRVGGAWTLFGKTATTWDPTHSVALTNEVWIDSNDESRAIGRQVYDMTTGNVIERWKPVQNAANTTKTTLSYDSRKLFVTGEVNELGHPFAYSYEYGTGTKILTEGPNFRGCTTNCQTGSLYPVREQRKERVDGLGRTIEHWETRSDDGSQYLLTLFSKSTYTEGSSTVPSSVLQETALNAASTNWKQERTELDGHGRPKRKILYAQGTVPNDHITTFTYRADGTLASASVPDPSANDSSTVSYAYSFDSLGRPTALRRPDSTIATNQSGLNISYDGLTTTRSDVVGAAGGPAATTKTVLDAFGRLVEVHEQRLASPVTWAVTRYTFGPDDLVSTVVDPENVTTTLVHDIAGQRTAITRHGRTWKYSYDANGNMVTEQAPGATDPLSALDYTTTTVYDDLDRPVSKSIAKRDLSDADRIEFVSGTEEYVWDYGANHIGHLRYFKAYAPNASAPAITLNVANDNQGNRTTTTHQLQIAGFPSLSRQFRNTYLPFGAVKTTSYNDQVGGTNETTATFNYDLRGMPSGITLARSTLPTLNIATTTRNVAGLVTKRRNNVSTSMGYVESNWTYDKLGRVTDQVVQKGPGTTHVVRQNLAYFGGDDPKYLDHYFGTTLRHFDYGYDLRHQLVSVQSSIPGYFAAAYEYGAAGRLTRASESQTVSPPVGSEVRSRDVNYQYGDLDPERVVALVNASGTHQGSPFSAYTYDAAGNQLTRCYGASATPCTDELSEYTYDGLNQLRRVVRRMNGSVQASEEYFYAEGQRIAVVKRDAAGVKTGMTWFIGDVEAAYDGVGSLIHIYTHISLGTPIARLDRTGNTSVSLEFQFHGVGSSMISGIDESGTENVAMVHSPFGETLEVTDGGGLASGAAAHPRRYNDKYRDTISGLLYYGTRYFDPILQTWIQGDPLYRFMPDLRKGSPRRRLMYSFCLNNPNRYLDPDGREPAKFPVVIQDVSGSSAETAKVAALVTQVITESFKARSGGHGDQMIQAASNGSVVASVSLAKSAADTNSRGITFVLTDFSKAASLKGALQAGVPPAVLRAMQETRTAPAGANVVRSDGEKGKVAIAINRIQRDLARQGDDLNTAEGLESAKKDIEGIIVHEAGHSLGLCHAPECEERDDDEWMDENAHPANQERSWRQEDLVKMGKELARRAL